MPNHFFFGKIFMKNYTCFFEEEKKELNFLTFLIYDPLFFVWCDVWLSYHWLGNNQDVLIIILSKDYVGIFYMTAHNTRQHILEEQGNFSYLHVRIRFSRVFLLLQHRNLHRNHFFICTINETSSSPITDWDYLA